MARLAPAFLRRIVSLLCLANIGMRPPDFVLLLEHREGVVVTCPLGDRQCEMGAACVSPTFCAACRDADRRKARGEQPRHVDPALWHVPTQTAGRPTLRVTVEAILYSVRERGLGALDEPENRERLARCDERALEQIDNRIAKLGDIRK